MPLVQDQSLDLLTRSPAHYHCTMDAPSKDTRAHYGYADLIQNEQIKIEAKHCSLLYYKQKSQENSQLFLNSHHLSCFRAILYCFNKMTIILLLFLIPTPNTLEDKQIKTEGIGIVHY